MKGYHIAVVGATGAVGQELLHVLERRSFPVATLRPIGSARSAGKSVRFRDESIPVEKLDPETARGAFDKIDIAFFSAGGDISRKYVPVACQADAVVIDNSSVFRMDPDVPLVIPEINADDIRRHRGHYRESELHDGGRAHGALSVASRFWGPPYFRRELPGGLRQRRARDCGIETAGGRIL